MRRLMSLLLAAVCTAAIVSGCGSDDRQASDAPTSNRDDAGFVVAMAFHHERAIEVGQLAADRGSDGRVRDFGRLIVAQQTPELDRLRQMVKDIPGTALTDMTMPEGYVRDPDLARLKSQSGTTFDRTVLLESATSEEGAAVMAQRELASGVYPPARELATSIATAPTTQIPQLRELAAALPG